MTPTQITEAIATDLRTLGHDIEIAWEMNTRFTNRIGDATWRPNGKHLIRFGTKTFGALDDVSQRETVAHEVAHIVAAECHGRLSKPHGWQWQAVMSRLGYRGASSCMDVGKKSDEIQAAFRAVARKKTRYVVVCLSCENRTLVTRGTALKISGYRCARCRGEVVATGEVETV
jgi:predicted SprT family Zn-dependent metalloprotease